MQINKNRIQLLLLLSLLLLLLSFVNARTLRLTSKLRRDADKSLAFPISPTFGLIILLSHQSLLFCMCLT
jgi:hypothetical protein